MKHALSKGSPRIVCFYQKEVSFRFCRLKSNASLLFCCHHFVFIPSTTACLLSTNFLLQSLTYFSFAILIEPFALICAIHELSTSANADLGVLSRRSKMSFFPPLFSKIGATASGELFRWFGCDSSRSCCSFQTFWQRSMTTRTL